MLDSASYKNAEEQQQEPAGSAQRPCGPADESPECEKEALSLAERMTGIPPRPRKMRTSR
jgi:hypothetical protein